MEFDDYEMTMSLDEFNNLRNPKQVKPQPENKPTAGQAPDNELQTPLDIIFDHDPASDTYRRPGTETLPADDTLCNSEHYRNIFIKPSAIEDEISRITREQKAKMICSLCSLGEQCLAIALEQQQTGIWAGTEEIDRKRLAAEDVHYSWD